MKEQLLKKASELGIPSTFKQWDEIRNSDLEKDDSNGKVTLLDLCEKILEYLEQYPNQIDADIYCDVEIEKWIPFSEEELIKLINSKEEAFNKSKDRFYTLKKALSFLKGK